MLEIVLRGVLPSIAAALLLVSLLGMRVLPLAAGLGLYAAHGLLKRAWPPLPHELWHDPNGVAWLVWGCIGAAVLATAERFGVVRPKAGTILAPLVVAAATWLSLDNLIARWDLADTALYAGSAVLVAAATVFATRRGIQRVGASLAPAVLFTAVLSADAMLATFGKSAFVAQLCGAVSAALGTAVGVRWWRKGTIVGPADATWLAMAHAGFVLVSVHLAYLEWGAAICALAAPFALLLLPRAGSDKASWQRTLLATALLLAPMAAALAWAWPASDPYGY